MKRQFASDTSTVFEPVQLNLSAGQHVFKLTGTSTLTTTAIGGDFAQFNSSWLKITQE